MDRHRSDGADDEYGGPPLDGQQFLTYADLEARYQKSRPTIWRWVRSGRLPVPIRAGPNSVLFAVPELLEKEAGWRRVTYGPGVPA